MLAFHFEIQNLHAMAKRVDKSDSPFDYSKVDYRHPIFSCVANLAICKSCINAVITGAVIKSN